MRVAVATTCSEMGSDHHTGDLDEKSSNSIAIHIAVRPCPIGRPAGIDRIAVDPATCIKLGYLADSCHYILNVSGTERAHADWLGPNLDP